MENLHFVALKLAYKCHFWGQIITLITNSAICVPLIGSESTVEIVSYNLFFIYFNHKI